MSEYIDQSILSVSERKKKYLRSSALRGITRKQDAEAMVALWLGDVKQRQRPCSF